MLFGANLTRGEDAFHLAFFVNEEGGAQKPNRDFAITVLLSPHSHGVDEGFVRVSNETEGQLMSCDELLMTLCTIGTHTDHFIPHLSEFAVVVAKRARLSRTAWRLIFGIEIENYFSTCIFTDAHFLTILIHTKNFGKFVADINIRR